MSGSQVPAFGIVDAFLNECSITREQKISGDVTQAFTMQITLLDPPSEVISVELRVTVAPVGAAPDMASNPWIRASATYLFVVDKTVDVLPSEWTLPLLQVAWPYLRSALDTAAGQARVPAFALPVAPPSFTIESPSKEATDDGA